MPTIENHAEHPFHLPKPTHALPGEGPLQSETAVFQEAILFPRAGKVDDEGNPEPSRTVVSAEALERLRKHPIAKGWFKPVAGKLQLTVSDKDDGDSMPLPNENALGGKKQERRQA